MGKIRGTYALVLTLDKEATISVGKLTTFSFPPGYYLYIGSALGGLFPRISRHVRPGRKLHWHIDYLMQKASVDEVWYLVSGKRWECNWCKAAAGLPRARILVAGFGSSDCGCRSHLLYFNSMPSFEVFRRRLGKEGRGLTRMCIDRSHNATPLSPKAVEPPAEADGRH